MMTESAQQTVAEFIERHHIGMEVGKPTPYYNSAEDWPAIAYRVTLYDQTEQPGGVLVENKRRDPISFKLGIGHVKPRDLGSFVMTASEQQAVRAMKGGRRFKVGENGAMADAAAKLARSQKVKPSAADVLDNLRHTLREFYDRYSFEEWASEYGYDTDSRKAEQLYKDCQAEGRATYDWLGEARAVELMNTEPM